RSEDSRPQGSNQPHSAPDSSARQKTRGANSITPHVQQKAKKVLTSWLSETNYVAQAVAVWNIGKTGACSRSLAAIPAKSARMLRNSAVTNVPTKRMRLSTQATDLLL